MNISAYKYLFTSLFISLKHPRGRITGINGISIFLAIGTNCQVACQESCILPLAKQQTSHFTQPCPNWML